VKRRLSRPEGEKRRGGDRGSSEDELRSLELESSLDEEEREEEELNDELSSSEDESSLEESESLC